jgi:hypothetical protein
MATTASSSVVREQPSLREALREISKLRNWKYDTLSDAEQGALVLEQEFSRLQVGLVDLLRDEPIDREKLVKLLYPT